MLKVKLSNIRSRDPTISIFIFEGESDIGPYEVWASRLDDQLQYQSLPGAGKAQLLDLRRRLIAQPELQARVYFFIDRDFDSLRGQTEGPDLFCTETYSIENLLVSERVLHSLLNDEFRCDSATNDKATVAKLFEAVFRQFLNCMTPVNNRIYLSKRLGIKSASVNERIHDYVDISLSEISTKLSPEVLSKLLPLEREPTETERSKHDGDFQKLVPQDRHRGKFHLAFFLRWLSLLIVERASNSMGLFSEAKAVPWSTSTLTLRSLASRSSIPQGLRNFLENVRESSSS